MHVAIHLTACASRGPLRSATTMPRVCCTQAFNSQQPPTELAAAVSGLVAECKGRPLALQMLGASLVGKKLTEWQILIERLRAADRELPVTQAIMKVCQPSYDALPPYLQKCFMDFAAYPEDAHVAADEPIALWAARAPSMSRASITAAERQLQQLQLRSLVSVDDEGCYHMHDVLRDIAVLEAHKRGDRALAAGVANLPHKLCSSPRARNRIADRAPHWMRKRTLGMPGIKQVSLHSNRGAQSWSGAVAMPDLKVLDLQNSSATSLPNALATFSKLRVLSLAGMHQLRHLPDQWELC
jgi:hypothetical protein